MITAGSIMANSAALLNDTARQIFTNTNQLPYLNIALKELQEQFALNNVPVTSVTSAVINVPAGITEIGFQTTPPTTNPVLPDNLVEIQQIWERLEGTNPYIPMTKVDYLPHYLEGQLVSAFSWWAWQDQKILILESNQDNDLKLNYIKHLFPEIEDEDDPIEVINADSFLHYRVAGLCAQFIGEDKARADSLNMMAIAAIERSVGISVKGGQLIRTRRLPFRAAFKARNYLT